MYKKLIMEIKLLGNWLTKKSITFQLFLAHPV